MNDDQNAIPAEKVRELATKYSGDVPTDPHFLMGEIKADLRALLPAPPQPTTGLLGRWAHDGFGQVLIISDGVLDDGTIPVVCGGSDWTDPEHVPLDSLAFPEQATRPREVPAGEAWRVRHCEYGEFNAVKTSGPFPWRFFNPEVEEHDGFRNNSITLIAPLTPERPASDLQAKYDAMDAKYREAQEKIEALSQDTTPHTATTEAEYAALPEGSMFVDADDYVWKRGFSGNWIHELSGTRLTDAKISGTTRTVLRYGWGDKQPAWRIEHDWRNLRGDEYIIDKNGDPVVTETKHWAGEPWYTDSLASVVPEYARFIVFPSKDAATPEAVAEAKRARDKEMGK